MDLERISELQQIAEDSALVEISGEELLELCELAEDRLKEISSEDDS